MAPVYIDLNIRQHLGDNVGVYGSYNSRPDCYRYGMVNGLLNQGCNVGWGTPQFSQVGNSWNYNGHNPYIAQQVYAEKAWERSVDRAFELQRGAIMAQTGVVPGPWYSASGRPMTAQNIYTGQTYGTGYYGNDRCFGNGLQISGCFNSRANFVDFNFSNNSFGRPSYFGGGPRTSVDVGLNVGGVHLDVGVNSLFRRFL